MIEISKADWKLYRERVPQWQEHYMERLAKEYIDLLSSPGYASEHFCSLENRIKEDKRNPGVQIQLRKSTAVRDIASFIYNEVITFDDLEGFSSELIKDVKFILS